MFLGNFHSKLETSGARSWAKCRDSALNSRTPKTWEIPFPQKLKQKLLSSNLRPLVPNLVMLERAKLHSAGGFEGPLLSVQILALSAIQKLQKLPTKNVSHAQAPKTKNKGCFDLTLWCFRFLVNYGRLIKSPWIDCHLPTLSKDKNCTKSSEVKTLTATTSCYLPLIYIRIKSSTKQLGPNESRHSVHCQRQDMLWGQYIDRRTSSLRGRKCSMLLHHLSQKKHCTETENYKFQRHVS